MRLAGITAVVFLVVGFFAASGEANPSPFPDFQVYILGATVCPEETWCIADPAFTLVIVVGFGPAVGMKPSTWEHVTLVTSYPELTTGTISIAPLSYGGFTPPAPVLLTVQDSFGVDNPNADADYDGLTNYPGLDSYRTKNFLPDPPPTPSGDHEVFANDVSEFALFGLAALLTPADALAFTGDCFNYDASTGIIVNESPGQECVEMRYDVTLSGFAGRAHFDVYGFDADMARWRMNPFSHDAEWRVAEPGSAALLGTGLLALISLRRRMRAALGLILRLR